MVKVDRARTIASAVLDKRRTFPNAIVLATNLPQFDGADSTLTLPANTKFFVVDGQHRLYAQEFSLFEATYACLIHMGLNEVDMARLFLEINDTQKRVPSSLRWDLARLVRPEEDPYAATASQIVFDLAMTQGSPLYQRIDLTGEQGLIRVKQGSLAPEIRTLVSRHLKALEYDQQYDLFLRYFSAIKSIDPDGWNSGGSVFYGNRVIRALLRLVPDLLKKAGKGPGEIGAADFRKLLERINPEDLKQEKIVAAQGGAGIKAIYETLREQVFGRAG